MAGELQPHEVWQKKRDYNRTYHARRWSTDPEYRERKREQARITASAPDFNHRRREYLARRHSDPNAKKMDAERIKRWALAHAKTIRSYQLRSKYNLTPQDVERMLGEQSNSCFLCEEQFTKDRPHKIDHCHETKVIRGLLCHRCNTALGKFKDSPALLRKAADYVERWKRT